MTVTVTRPCDPAPNASRPLSGDQQGFIYSLRLMNSTAVLINGSPRTTAAGRVTLGIVIESCLLGHEKRRLDTQRDTFQRRLLIIAPAVVGCNALLHDIRYSVGADNGNVSQAAAEHPAPSRAGTRTGFIDQVGTQKPEVPSAMKMKAYASFDQYSADQAPRNQDIIRALRRFVKRIAPQLQESVKWGNGCWVQGKAPVAYVYSAPDHVQFGFFRGSALQDPNGLLKGEGKFVRHIKVRKRSDIEESAFENLLRQAMQ